MEIIPQCHPYSVVDGEIQKQRKTKRIAYTSTGYILPCCWCDVSGNKAEREDYVQFGLFDEDLKLKNNENIKNILLSKQWVNFHKTLLDSPEKAPIRCKRYCGTENG
jgi:hypothetical protein